ELKALKDTGLIHGFRVDFAEGLADWHDCARRLSSFGLPIWFEVTRGHGQKLPPGVVGTTGGGVIAAFLRACTHGEGLRRIVAAGAERTGSPLTFAEHMAAVARSCLSQDWYRCHAERLQRLLKELDGPEVPLETLVEGLLYFRRRTHPDFKVGADSLSAE